MSSTCTSKTRAKENPGCKPKLLLRFQCYVCKRRFVNSAAFSYHVRSHGIVLQAQPTRQSSVSIVAKGLAFNCKLCKRNFSSSLSLRNHARVHKSRIPLLPVQKDGRDELCTSVEGRLRGNEFDSKYSLTVDLQSHKQEMECSKLLNQVPSHLPTLKKIFQCLECLKSFASEAPFRRHRKTHLGLEWYECKECGIRFLQRCHLREHLMAHKTMLAYRCSRCTASYDTQMELAVHLDMHANLNAMYVTCVLCKFAFINKSVLDIHITARHTRKQQFECDICHSQFSVNSQLQQHTRLHKQLKSIGLGSSEMNSSNNNSAVNFVCNVCGDKFSLFRYLKLHMRKEHYKFYCDVCCTYFDETYIGYESKMPKKTVCMSCYPSSQRMELSDVSCNRVNTSFQGNKSLVELVRDFLHQLVDDELLKSKGVLEKSVGQQLEAVLELCDPTSVKSTSGSAEECLHKNLKSLFVLCVGTDSLSFLLDHKPIEEVLCSMLKSLQEE